MIKNISVLGSTGSIGTQTLDVVDKLNLNVTALTANSNVKLTEQQIRKYKPQIAVLFDEEKAKELQRSKIPIQKFSAEWTDLLRRQPKKAANLYLIPLWEW